MKHDHPMDAAVEAKPEQEREITKAINTVQVLREMVLKIADEARYSADNLFGEEPGNTTTGLDDFPSGDAYQLHFNLSQTREAIEQLGHQVSRLSRI